MVLFSRDAWQILEYAPISNKRATGLSLTLKDDRARLILHMNWKAQSVPVLIRGLPHKDDVAPNDTTDWKALPPPPVEKVRECSPYWHILQGDYRTPTFMVHGNIDEWIPYPMTQKTVAALQERGVPCGIRIPDQCGHAFDLFPREDRLGVGWPAIEAAYDFACSQLAMDAGERKKKAEAIG
jgi:acetyl esterase/lipase